MLKKQKKFFWIILIGILAVMALINPESAREMARAIVILGGAECSDF